MDSVAISAPRRLLRILAAGGILAAGWLAIDLLTHSQPASAADIVDVIPVGSASAVDSILPPVAEPPAPIAAPALAAPALREAVAPVIAPVATVVAPVAPVIAPALPVVDTVTAPLQPVIETVAPLVPQLSVPSAVGELLTGGGLLLLGAVGASSAPLLPLPSQRGGSPSAPASPSGSTDGASGVPGDLIASLSLRLGSALSAAMARVRLPLSPTYAFDTTPD